MASERATKMLILSSARTLFSEKGYEQTPVEEICILAGVAKGTFFYHFESKQYIVRYILAQQLSEFSDKLYKQLETLEGAIAKIEFFVTALIDLSEERSETETYFNEGLPEWFRMVESEEKMLALYPLLEEIVVFGIDEGSFRIKHPSICASIAFLGIGQYLNQYAWKDDGVRHGIREFTAKTLGMREAAFAI